MNNKSIKKVMLLSLFTIISSTVFAEKDDNSRNPTGCNDVGYSFDLKTLKFFPHHAGAGQSLYFLYNHTGQTITLFQMRDQDSSHSMFFNHRIGGSNWAVLATCEKKMKYLCALSDNKLPYGKIVDCKDYLRVCEFDSVKFGLNNQGNYWLVNSTSRNAAVREVVRYGIIPSMN